MLRYVKRIKITFWKVAKENLRWENSKQTRQESYNLSSPIPWIYSRNRLSCLSGCSKYEWVYFRLPTTLPIIIQNSFQAQVVFVTVLSLDSALLTVSYVNSSELCSHDHDYPSEHKLFWCPESSQLLHETSVHLIFWFHSPRFTPATRAVTPTKSSKDL